MPRRGGFTRALGPLLLALLAGAASGANLAAACDASVRPALPGVAFQHCAVLRARSGDTPEVRLLWRLHDENATIGVHVDMPLAEIGFVGVGASWNGGMKGAEMWIARVVDGAFTHEAYWSEDYVRPVPSSAAQRAIALLGYASVAGQGSTWAFTRPVRAADGGLRTMQLARPQGDIMLWAMSTEPGEYGYHGAELRGSRRVLLAGAAAVDEPADAPDSRVVSVVTPPIATDGTVSRYCWSWHKLPSDRKHHITRVTPKLVHPELKSLVHHMVTYACPDSFMTGGGGADGDTLRAGGVVCRNEGSMNFIGWADAGTIVYPREAGFPFGLGETKSILLEMHYENIARTKGIVDTSGLEFTYTPTLRPHDLGYIIVGDALEEQVPELQRNPQVLPAGHAEYEVANMCPASCTRRMADEDLHVVSTTFHMHVKGVHAYLEMFRDGKRQGRISEQAHWDFLRQDALPSGGQVIHPGDALLTRCVFNTRNSTSLLPPYVTGVAAPGGEQPVVGGFGTYNADKHHFEEMCYAFVLVWPRPRRSTCIDLRNTGWPGVVYCEDDPLHRMLPRNVLIQPSDPHTTKYEQFVLDRAAPAPPGIALPPAPPRFHSF